MKPKGLVGWEGSRGKEGEKGISHSKSIKTCRREKCFASLVRQSCKRKKEKKKRSSMRVFNRK